MQWAAFCLPLTFINLLIVYLVMMLSNVVVNRRKKERAAVKNDNVAQSGIKKNVPTLNVFTY